LEQNREAVLARLTAACAAASRAPDAARLVAVTKSVTAEVAAALVELGQRDLGEARVDALERKAASLAARGLEPVWHLVGHLQRNKARRAVRVADAIHSVDSLELLRTLERVAGEEGRRPAVFLQVKLTAEETKFGLAPEDLPACVESARGARALSLVGLMTMAPLPPGDGSEDAAGRAAARATFARLAALGHELPGDAFAGGRPLLSMGMSGDFELAVACGADLVRVGTALFAGLERAPEGCA
jgi:pyridoxal phosphate enzyme (YggS family)